MKIYDCFPFFNELDLLEIRLNELWDVVDFFVLSEATVTHQNKPKPLYYEKNKNRFKKYESKIIHNVITDASNIYNNDAWNIDHYMHDNFISKGIIQDDDLILIGDADHIVRKSVLQNINYTRPMCLHLDYFYYFFNCKHIDMTWDREFIIKKKDLHFPVHQLRYHFDTLGIDYEHVVNAGWHFSYLGGIEKIKEKVKAFSDVQAQSILLDDSKLLELINSGQDLYGRTNEGRMEFIIMDETFPKYILDNKENYLQYIKE